MDGWIVSKWYIRTLKHALSSVVVAFPQDLISPVKLNKLYKLYSSERLLGYNCRHSDFHTKGYIKMLILVLCSVEVCKDIDN